MLISERFHLDQNYCAELRTRPVNWGFGFFSEVIYYRTYSRQKEDGSQEKWADTVLRVVEGCLSIRKSWFKQQGLKWRDQDWQLQARELANAIFDMKFLPPGRGLWAMGTEYIYERGSMALNNCAFVDVTDDLADSAGWAMDALMCGVGVGFSTQNARFARPHRIDPSYARRFVIPDSREGWVESVVKQVNSYLEPDIQPYWRFDYSQIRPEGVPLRGLGGVASGPGPLIKLHQRIGDYLDHAAVEATSPTRIIADLFNAIGACVVSGNIRRSAQLATGCLNDDAFLNLKNLKVNPSRADIYWMSNNSVILRESEEFEGLPKIANLIRDNGEPGILNWINVQKYARYGKKKPDFAVGMNPCAEIPLEDRELCNLVEVFPTRCTDLPEFWRMLELATFYATTVTLLPNHSEATNAVIARNRRIGVSVSGIADWVDATSLSHVTMALRRGYEEHVEPANIALAKAAGVPPSVRLTTVKPSGTVSLLPGVSPGMHWPVARYAIRRVRMSETSPLIPVLKKAGIPCEPDAYSDKTMCLSFPLSAGNGKTRAASEVSVWEQASLAAMLQREWADNSVSNTLSFTGGESDQIERVMAAFAPVTKAMSFLPDQEEKAGKGYVQPPYERISVAAYKEMSRKLQPVDWSQLGGSDGIDPRYCANDTCEVA